MKITAKHINDLLRSKRCVKHIRSKRKKDKEHAKFFKEL